MRKTVFILMALFSLALMGQAQTRKNSSVNATAIGLKGGVSMPGMLFTDDNLAALPQDLDFKPIGGIYVDIPLGEAISLVPEVMFVQRGMSTSYEHYSGSLVNYSINSRYVDYRLPVAYRFRVADAFQPYIIVGLEGGYLLGGQIHLDRTSPSASDPIAMETTIDIGSANMTLLHAGVYAGLGVRSDIDLGSFGLSLKFEATYHQGVIDSYSQMEHDELSTPLNVNAYNITGLRLPRGLELCIGIGLPLKFNTQKDACWSFSRNKYN